MDQHIEVNRLIATGGLFKLDKHELKEERGEYYLLMTVTHTATDASYFNHFTCIPANVPYRPALEHKKPVMRGPQSAIVTGPAGEEIYIDEYGRNGVDGFAYTSSRLLENSPKHQIQSFRRTPESGMLMKSLIVNPGHRRAPV